MDYLQSLAFVEVFKRLIAVEFDDKLLDVIDVARWMAERLCVCDFKQLELVIGAYYHGVGFNNLNADFP
jgi:hypothetical protein